MTTTTCTQPTDAATPSALNRFFGHRGSTNTHLGRCHPWPTRRTPHHLDSQPPRHEASRRSTGPLPHGGSDVLATFEPWLDQSDIRNWALLITRTSRSAFRGAGGRTSYPQKCRPGSPPGPEKTILPSGLERRTGSSKRGER
jgi:hypothetical protein